MLRGETDAGAKSNQPKFIRCKHPRAGDMCMLLLGGGSVFELMKADLAPPSSWFIDQSVKQGTDTE